MTGAPSWPPPWSGADVAPWVVVGLLVVFVLLLAAVYYLSRTDD